MNPIIPSIVYDPQIFSLQKFGGISRYFVELMKNLPNEFDYRFDCLYSDNVYLKENSSLFPKIRKLPNFPQRKNLTCAINISFEILKLRQNKLDLFHPTYFSDYFLKHLKKPYVITVYDLIHERFLNNEKLVKAKEKTIKHANKIIAISHHTKKDLMDIYGIPSEKIEVTYLSHSINCNIIEEVEELPKDYILFVGQRNLYKNFKNFLEAFYLLSKENSNLNLVCTGAPFNPEEIEQIKKYELEDRVKRYFVSEGQLNFLYKNAQCFVYPSIYEGFGIPILEAFACECPVSLSNASCFPEVAGDAGSYFDPHDPYSIKISMEKILTDISYRNSLIYKGCERLKLFSWKKTAQETADIYKSILL